MAVSVFALVAAIDSILSGGRMLDASVAIIYASVAVTGCFALAAYMHHAAQQTGSTLVAVDAKGWLLDGIISSAVLLAFLAMFLLRDSGWTAYLPYVDPALVAVLVVIALPLPLLILRENMREVLAMAPRKAIQDEIRQRFLEAIKGVEYQDVCMRMLKNGRQYYLFAHITLDQGFPIGNIAALDRIREKIDAAMRGYDKNVEMDVAFIGDSRWAY
jgi:predicted Co/Zn/Cd cation transporter (cation efflux family)